MATRPTKRYLALLRGINVGGKNIIAKDALRVCFEDLGFSSVRTYIQSGNILFRSSEASVAKLTREIERLLSDRFDYPAQAAILSHPRYQSALRAAPKTWGRDDQQKHNALFTLSGITPARALAQLPAPKAQIETVTTGPGVIFWSASKKALSRSTMLKLHSLPAYQLMTVRNHNTVFKLLELFESI